MEVLGVFNGMNMLGDDGKIYPMPQNYCSKSKLVEGDRLKMIVCDAGIFFKQIELVKRLNFIGEAKKTDKGIIVMRENKHYKVSDTVCRYYKIKQGDTIMAVIPKFNYAEYCAIEGVIENNN